MAALYRIRNQARNYFYVVASSEGAAQSSYESWVSSSPEAPPAGGTDIFSIDLVAADTAVEDPNYPWATLVTT